VVDPSLVFMYVPVEQEVQYVDPSIDTYFPSEHVSQLVPRPLISKNNLSGQTLQKVAPSVHAYFPEAQATQLVPAE
jgi:hypothetical protein